MAATPRISARAWAFNALFGAVLALEAYAEHRRQQRALQALSDPMLKDIGLSRCGAARPVSRLPDAR